MFGTMQNLPSSKILKETFKKASDLISSKEGGMETVQPPFLKVQGSRNPFSPLYRSQGY